MALAAPIAGDSPPPIGEIHLRQSRGERFRFEPVHSTRGPCHTALQRMLYGAAMQKPPPFGRGFLA